MAMRSSSKSVGVEEIQRHFSAREGTPQACRHPRGPASLLSMRSLSTRGHGMGWVHAAGGKGRLIFLYSSSRKSLYRKQRPWQVIISLVTRAFLRRKHSPFVFTMHYKLAL